MSEVREGEGPRRRTSGRASRSSDTARSSDSSGSTATDEADALSGVEILAAVRDLADDLGWQSEAIAGLRRNQSGWTATVDVVETSRTPSTTDVIGVYEVDLDARGTLLGFRRLRHYVRGRGDNERDR